MVIMECTLFGGLFGLFWIFATPYSISGHKSRKDTPLDILKKRFAAGQITEQEFLEKKKIILG